jgi:tetratricopeptide (TPR) repeat protein
LGETLRIALEQSRSAPFTRADAEKQYDEALRLQQQIHEQKPANSIYQQELARTYYNRGILRYDNGDLNNSESDFRQATRLLEPLADKNAGVPAENTSPPPSQELARVYDDLATLLGSEGRTPEGVQFSAGAVGIQEGLRKKEPDNREYKMELAQFYFTMADLLSNENHLGSAEQRSEQAVVLYEELATPAASLRKELANARMLRDRLLKIRGTREAPAESQQEQEVLELKKRQRLHDYP